MSNKIEEVKKILGIRFGSMPGEAYYAKYWDDKRQSTAQEICQLTDAECQAKIREIFEEIEDYIIESRRKLKDERDNRKKIEPNDISNQIILGSKLKAFQQVLDKLQSIKRRRDISV